MKRNARRISFCAALFVCSALTAQVTFNPVPARVLGHAQLTLSTANPNLVEGRELYAPQSVALDTSVAPPILYVADALNNRVLAWRDANSFLNGAAADVWIGQRDRFSTLQLGPGTTLSGGLYLPTGVAVDKDGNLFVADSGNNRILRFPKPFEQSDSLKAPDLVLGQTTLTSRAANAGGRSEKSLALFTSPPVPAQLVFDAQGNLYCTDPGNGRVLRYPAAAVASGASAFGPSADLVVGQVNFTAAPRTPASATDLSTLLGPAGIAIDPAGRIYVSDAFHRVLVWEPPHTVSGRAAQRLIGGVWGPQGDNKTSQPPSELSLDSPQGIFFAGNVPYVVDTGNSRILRYDPYETWPAAAPPPAKGVIGQTGFAAFRPNRGGVLPATDRVSLYEPVSAVFLNRLYIADSGNHRVLVLPDAASDALASPPRVLGQEFPDAGSPNRTEGREFNFGGFRAGIAVDRKSNPPRLYVADTFNNRVLCFRDARNLRPGDRADLVIGQPDFVKTLANFPSNDVARPGQNTLYRPTGVAVDDAGNLYVADSGNGRVLRFANPFSEGVNQPNANLVLGKLNFTQSILAAPDPSSRNMVEPYGLAFAVDGHLLVSDRAANRVLYFRKPAGGDFADGMAAEKVFGQPDFVSTGAGNLPNRLRNPRHIGTDTDDRLYVCDTENGRIQIFSRVTTAGPDPSAVLSLSNLDGPQGIFVSAVTGEVWVADWAPSWAVNTRPGRLLQYPMFNVLFQKPEPEVVLSAGAGGEQPLAVTLDSFGNLMTAYSTNRIAMYFAAVTPANAANYLSRITPGMIAALFPLDQFSRRFGEQAASAPSGPLPTELADIQVLVNDRPAPLFFVSPDQINFMVPMSAPSSGSLEIQVVRKSNGQIIAVGCSAARAGTKPDGTQRWACTSAAVPMDVASPALFAGAGYSAGSGQVAAQNRRRTDGSYYGANSPSNPVARGDFVEIYGTGQGFVPGAPPDGTPPAGAVRTPDLPRVIVGTRFVDDSDVQYSGLAPGLVGVWQINLRIPDWVAPNNETRVAILHKDISSQTVTTIAVKQ